MRKSATDDKTVLASSVYDALMECIMDQVYPPGERMNIDTLAVELTVSPTPVREALARLAAERLVTFEPYKGYRVSPLLSSTQVTDLMHVRRLLELDAVRLAAQRIRVPDLMVLEGLMADSAAIEVGSWSHGYRQFNQLDKRFHVALLAASGNSFLIDAYRSLNVHVELGRFYPVFAEMDHRETLAEHEAVYAALRARSPDAAVDTLAAHLSATELRIFRLIEQHSHLLTSVNGSTTSPNMGMNTVRYA